MDVSVDDYIASRGNEEQRADYRKWTALLRKVTGRTPKMWGPSGSYRYTYESGRTGTASLCGFAMRGRELVAYLRAESEEQKALRSQLGKHKMGKSSLYFKRLDDLDPSVLEQLVRNSIADIKRRHGSSR